MSTSKRKRKKSPPKPKVHRPPPKLMKIYAREGGKCFWCKKDLVLWHDTPPKKALMPTKDHVLPRSKGGTNDISNLVLCCSRCNGNKGDLLVNPVTGWRINPEAMAIFLREG